MAFCYEEVITDERIKGRREGIAKAIEHIKLQHTVWDNTSIPPKALMDLLTKNLEALRDLQ